MNTTMTRRKTAGWCALGLVLGSVGFAGWSVQREAEVLRGEAADAKRANERQRAERTALAGRVRELQEELGKARTTEVRATQDPSTPAERRRQSVLDGIAALRASGRLAAPAGGAMATVRRLPPNGAHGNVYFPELFSDPRYARAYAAWQRQQIERRFAPLLRGLPLGAVELARFKDLLVQREMAYEEVDGIMEVQAMREKKTVDRSQAMQTKTRVVRMFDEEITRSFGAEVFERYRTFLSGTGARQEIVGQLALRLSYSAAPLDDAQIAQLVDLFNGSRRAAVAEPRPAGSPFAAVASGFAAGAGAILKPEQMAALREVQTELAAGRGGSSVSIRRTPGR